MIAAFGSTNSHRILFALILCVIIELLAVSGFLEGGVLLL